MDSIWCRTAEIPSFPPLQGDLDTDVLIIGGGMAGLLCAHKLDRAGVDYALVEARRLCGGVTRNTTAKITAQHGLIYHRLCSSLGRERARLYLEANQAAVEEYRTLCRDIPCDFEDRDAFVYARSGRAALERELRALERLGAEADLVRELPLPFPTAGAVRFRRQAQFHPLKFAAGILTDAVLGRENPWAAVFLPGRSAFHPQLAVNGAHAVISLLTPTVPRCPHMGCALKYNRQEHSWDCPCHGSRFSGSGQLLDNPSTDDRKPGPHRRQGTDG